MTLSGRHIVLIEDDQIMGNSIAQRLELEGAEVTWVTQMVRGISAVRTPRRPVDAVVCDIRLPDGTGEELFEQVTRAIPPPPFLFITGQGDINQAVRLLRAGASDYVTKPFDIAEFLHRLGSILPRGQSTDLPPLSGVSPAARRVDSLAAEYAETDLPILIQGEGGLGKARLARRIHDLSDRRAAAFLEVNATRAGRASEQLATGFAEVGEGTLFINGAGRLPASAQDELLERMTHECPYRIIASIGTRIGEKVAAGSFRQDLLYALMAKEIVVPPLAQRREDAVWLARQIFAESNIRRKRPLKGISSLTEASILDHQWPGNGREVRSRTLRAVEVAEGDWVFPSDMFPELGEEVLPASLSEAREKAERRQILLALERTSGQVAEAARLLRVSRTTLWEKMQKLGL